MRVFSSIIHHSFNVIRGRGMRATSRSGAGTDVGNEQEGSTVQEKPGPGFRVASLTKVLGLQAEGKRSSGCSWALWLKKWAGLNGFVMMYL